MGMFPCDFGMHRYRGAQQTIYAAIVEGGEAQRRRLRLCPDHFATYLETLEERYRNAQLAFEDPQALACASCGQPVEHENVQFFATVYESGKERADWWSVLHIACRQAAAEDWLLDA